MRWKLLLWGTFILGFATPIAKLAASDGNSITCTVHYDHICDRYTCTSHAPKDDRIVIDESIVKICNDGTCKRVGHPPEIINTDKYRTFKYWNNIFVKVDLTTGDFINVKVFDLTIHRSIGKCTGTLFEK